MSYRRAGHRIIHTIRIVLVHALYHARLLHLWQRVALRNKAVVLMYHRVLTDEERRRTASHPGMIVDHATFTRQMEWLKRNFSILSLDEFADTMAARRPFARASCLVTFDDGWNDNLRNAWPVLRRLGIPAVIFLPVNLIGSKRLFTREALTHLVSAAIRTARQDPSRRAELKEILAPLGLDRLLDVADPDPQAAVVDALLTHRYAGGPSFENAVTALSATLGVEPSSLSELDTFITWNHVGSMGAGGISFGGHGADHHVLNRVSIDVAETEVSTSAQVLSSRLNRAPRAFAYPGGGLNEAVKEAIRRFGYQLAFTIEPGTVSCEDDALALRRVNVHEDMTATVPMFMARILGLL